ncbi:MAG TPA: hypothetical protein VNM72_11345 [Blastocatellia bacterium]|nr:hypothetical protein [Blastocatellia bacterium]
MTPRLPGQLFPKKNPHRFAEQGSLSGWHQRPIRLSGLPLSSVEGSVLPGEAAAETLRGLEAKISGEAGINALLRGRRQIREQMDELPPTG